MAPQGAARSKESQCTQSSRLAANNIVLLPMTFSKSEKIEGADGSEITFDQVFMIGSVGNAAKIGTPTVPGAKVIAELVDQTRGPKLINFKKRRRKNSRRKKGHRQDLTTIRIKSIVG